MEKTNVPATAPRSLDPESLVTLLADSLPYQDGAEDTLLEVMRTVSDRSSGSDELAGHIRDWPTRYHLSRQRANLLRPFSFPPGARVLDVGAGTGALSRHLAEQGLEVVALEGNLERARVASARCEGLANVEVFSGPIADFADGRPFDVVLCVGVLEYAHTAVGGEHGAEAFLGHLRDLLVPGGVLLLAIENQLGLKYLLGYPEDHLGRPWEGIEGYQSKGGPRTYSRAALGRLLQACGLEADQWLYPYPDYKLVSTVLADGAFRQPDTPVLVDQLVRRPAADAGRKRTLLCDDRGAHRTFLEAGLGAEVANSFLVVARRAGERAPALLAEDVLAWHFGNERLNVWRQEKRLLDVAGQRRVDVHVAPGIRERGWLSQRPEPVPFTAGVTFEQQVHERCAQQDVEGLAAVLRRWSDALAAHEQPVAAPVTSHPFVSAATTTVLPPAYLDCNLDNFLEARDGTVVFFDQEWRTCDPVDAQLARLRALWYLASHLVLHGGALPWSPSTTVDQLAVMLLRMAVPGTGLALERLQELREAEAEFQALVTGQQADRVLDRLTRQGQASRASGDVQASLPFTRLRAEARRAQSAEAQRQEAREAVATLRKELEEGRRRQAELAEARKAGEERLAELRTRRRELEQRLEEERDRAGQLTGRLAQTEQEVQRVHSRLAALGTEQKRLRLAAGQAGRALREREEQLQRLGEHVVKLQRDLRALLVSKHWRLGSALGDSLLGLVPGRRPARRGDELTGLMEDGYRLLDGVVPVKPEPLVALPDLDAREAAQAKGLAVASAKREAEQARQRREQRRQQPFQGFEDFLAHAITQPLVETPFDEPARRVLGVMDSRRRQLVARYGARPEGTRVSIVMPTFNRRQVLPRAIGSVLAQRYGNWELVVVDDGSTDGTADYLGSLEDERIRYLRLPTNGGVSAARNAGIDAARGDVIAYLDSDNAWHPDFLLVMVGSLADNPWAETAYCAQEIWSTTSAGGQEERELQGVRFGPFNRALIEHRNYVDLNAFVHTRAVAERLGAFDTSLQRLVDWELLLRYTAERGALAVPCVLSVYEFGAVDDQLTRSLPWRETLDELLRRLHTEELDLELPPRDEGVAKPRLHPLPSPVVSTRYERPVAVVVPSFEARDYLRLCIESVQAYTREHDYRLIVVDNGSGADVREYLESVASDDRIEVVLNDGNLGFTHAVNIGIERAGPDRDVVLLNNDAVVTPGWLRGLWEVFDRVEDVGLVAPRQTLLAGTPTMADHVPFSRADRELDVTLSAHHGNVVDPLLDPERGLVEASFVPFFCVYLPRTVLDELGPLNAEEAPHYRSDRLYCDMVRQFAGKKIVYTPHAKLYHWLQQSTQQLKRDDPQLYTDMYVRNDWSRVAARARRSAADGARG